MTVFSPHWTPSSVALRRGGAAVLWGGLALGLAGVLGGMWLMPEQSLLLPVLLIGAAGIGFLLRRPDLHLYVLLLAAMVILQHEPGVQTTEVVYGLYTILFLGAWLLSDLFGSRTVLASWESKLMLGFLVLAVALVPVAFMHGGTPHTVTREMTSLIMLAFFFPIRDICVRRPEGVRILVGIGMVLIVFVVVRNVMLYREVLSNAERLADMVAGRVVANEHMLAAGSLFGVVFLLYATSVRQTLASGLVFMMAFGGLLLSMSRGFWLAFAWGICLLLWVVDRRRRSRIVILGMLAVVAISAVALIFFGDFAQAYIDGIIDRIGSVQGSAKSDISVLGRIYEGRAALGHIVENPIVGHGVGVPFTFSTILTRTEVTTTFVHNGYIYIWYAFGLPGAALILMIWWGGIRAGLAAFRQEDAARLDRLVGLAVATSLFCYTLSAMTSNPFWHKDYLLGFAFLTGIGYGVQARKNCLQPIPSP